VLAILPEESRRKAEQSRLFAPDFGAQGSKAQFDLVHRAVSGQRVLALHYRDEAERCRSAVLPLGLFWGSAGCW
jgi:predicted DNA-binding transcriptional regulator YafY